MKNKLWLTSIFALCIATPAMAEGQIGLGTQNNVITDENNPSQLAQGKGCDESTLGVTEGTANIEAIWTPITYACSAGQYLFVGQENNQDVVECRSCPSGSYCGGAPQNNPYTVESHANDILSCSTVGDTTYTQSDSGSSVDTSCYKSCTLATANISHATSVYGRDYYGAGIDTCSATACSDGYHVEVNLGNNIVLSSDKHEMYAHINNSGLFGSSSRSTAADYGLTENNTWATKGDEYAVRGEARCSTTDDTNGDILDNVNSEFGQTNAEYCWCKMTDYKAINAQSYTNMQSKWVYYGNIDDGGATSGCARDCAATCGRVFARKAGVLMLLQGDVSDRLRAAILGSIDGHPATCSANNIGLNWWYDRNAEEPLSVQQSSQSCSYDGTIVLPNNTMEKAGYTFGGWKLQQELQQEF